MCLHVTDPDTADFSDVSIQHVYTYVNDVNYSERVT